MKIQKVSRISPDMEICLILKPASIVVIQKWRYISALDLFPMLEIYKISTYEKRN